jgi:hypothetical protein
MPDPTGGLILGGTLLGGAMSAKASKSAATTQATAARDAADQGADAARYAADLQMQAVDKGIGENSRQFDLVNEMLKPYYEAGLRGLSGYEGLAGLLGDVRQSQEMERLEGSPMFRSMYQQGEDAILQNAAATGGLRGGNVQGSLAGFRGNLLGGLVGQQLERYALPAVWGQNSAARVGSAAQGAGQINAQLLAAGGDAAARGVLGAAQANGQGILGAGNAGAAGAIGAGNAITNAVGGVTGLIASRGWTPTPVGGPGYGGAGIGGGGGFGSGAAFGNQDLGQYF